MKYLHTELIRLLEQRGYIFPTDPQLITEQLAQQDSAFIPRLYLRAEKIDKNKKILYTLENKRKQMRLLLLFATIIWFGSGFAGTYGLMQQNRLNFLLILSGILGVNTLMLLWWLLSLWWRHHSFNFFDLTWLFSKENDINQSLIQLYTQLAERNDFVWRKGIIMHRLALSALIGMFIAASVLLAVRQYAFNWESTLFDGNGFAQLISILAWLPMKLGFSVPDITAVLANRNHADVMHAAQWAYLLLGSIVCYGIIPRLLAWLICYFFYKKSHFELDLNNSYYQRIIMQWQRRITDIDDFQKDTPIIKQPHFQTHFSGQYWAVAIDAPHAPANWFQSIENKNWKNQGFISGRNELNEFLTSLIEQNGEVRLLIAVRSHIVPDRGIVRQLNKLSEQTHGGLCLYLLDKELNPDTHLQWQQICTEHAWKIYE